MRLLRVFLSENCSGGYWRHLGPREVEGLKQGAFEFNGPDLLLDVIFRKALLLMGRSVCRISIVDIGDREFSVLWEDPFSDINMFRPKTVRQQAGVFSVNLCDR